MNEEKEERDKLALIAELVSKLGLHYSVAEMIVNFSPELAEKLVSEEPLSPNEEDLVKEMMDKSKKLEEEEHRKLIRERISKIFEEEGVPPELTRYVSGERIPIKYGDYRWNTLKEITKDILKDARGRSLEEVYLREPNKLRIKAKLIKNAMDVINALEPGPGETWSREFRKKAAILGAGALFVLGDRRSKEGVQLSTIMLSKLGKIARRAHELEHSPKREHTNFYDAKSLSEEIMKTIKKSHIIAGRIRRKERREERMKKRQRRLPI